MNRPVRKLLHKKLSKEAVKSPFLFSVSVPSASQYSMRLIHYRVEAVTVHDRCRFFIPFYHSNQFDVVKAVLKTIQLRDVNKLHNLNLFLLRTR